MDSDLMSMGSTVGYIEVRTAEAATVSICRVSEVPNQLLAAMNMLTNFSSTQVANKKH